MSSIILQALKDLHNPDLEAEAQGWLDSPMCHLMLETRGMDPEELPAVIGRARERKPRLLGGAQGPGQGRADIVARGDPPLAGSCERAHA